MVLDSLIVLGLSALSLGTIQEADGPIERTFWLRNSGTQAVALTQGYTSCGCTTIQFAKDAPIQPGDSTAVTLRFNPRGKGGDFLETATLTYAPANSEATSVTSSPPKVGGARGGLSSLKRLHLSLSGICITSEETLLRQFPIRVSDSLRLSTDRFDLGIMHVGETKERNVVFLHLDDNNRQERILITFTPDNSTPKGLQHIVHPILVGNQQFSITLDVIIK